MSLENDSRPKFRVRANFLACYAEAGNRYPDPGAPGREDAY